MKRRTAQHGPMRFEPGSHLIEVVVHMKRLCFLRIDPLDVPDPVLHFLDGVTRLRCTRSHTQPSISSAMHTYLRCTNVASSSVWLPSGCCNHSLGSYKSKPDFYLKSQGMNPWIWQRSYCIQSIQTVEECSGAPHKPKVKTDPHLFQRASRCTVSIARASSSCVRRPTCTGRTD